MFNYPQRSVLAVQAGRGPFRRRGAWARAICIAVPLTLMLVGCDRLYGLVYGERGHVPGGAMAWQSGSTCDQNRLEELADLAAHDTPGTRSFSPGTPYAFSQNWPAPGDARGYPERSIGYFIDFAFDQDRSTRMFVYAEAALQNGASMPSTEFDAEYKARVKQFMDALMLRGNECGLSTSASIKYG